MAQPQSQPTPPEPKDLQDLTLGPKSTVTEVRDWIQAWHSAHLVTLPTRTLNLIIWDGRYIAKTILVSLYQLQQDLVVWGLDPSRARAIAAGLKKARRLWQPKYTKALALDLDSTTTDVTAWIQQWLFANDDWPYNRLNGIRWNGMTISDLSVKDLYKHLGDQEGIRYNYQSLVNDLPKAVGRNAELELVSKGRYFVMVVIKC